MTLQMSRDKHDYVTVTSSRIPSAHVALRYPAESGRATRPACRHVPQSSRRRWTIRRRPTRWPPRGGASGPPPTALPAETKAAWKMRARRAAASACGDRGRCRSSSANRKILVSGKDIHNVSWSIYWHWTTVDQQLATCSRLGHVMYSHVVPSGYYTLLVRPTSSSSESTCVVVCQHHTIPHRTTSRPR